MVILYSQEAHPNAEFPQPSNFDERRHHATSYANNHAVNVPIYLDGMQHTLRHEFGGAPNSAFVLDAEGVVRFKQRWESPQRLQQVIEHLLAFDREAKRRR